MLLDVVVVVVAVALRVPIVVVVSQVVVFSVVFDVRLRSFK